jgi:hypothetical protein
MDGASIIDRPLMVSRLEEERWIRRGKLSKIIQTREKNGYGSDDLAIQSAQVEINLLVAATGQKVSIKV